MSRICRVALVAIALSAWPQFVAAQQEGPSLSEVQKLLKTQQRLLEKQNRQLERQQEQIEQQSGELETQQALLQSMQTQLDQLATAAGKSPELTQADLALRERLKSVEQQLEEPPDTPANVVAAGEFPGSIRIPGTNMAGKVGGFVRLGVVNSFDPIGSDDRFIVASIPPEGEGEAGQDQRVTISAKRSRLNLDMRMDSSVGQFRAFLEGDFAGLGEGGTDNYRLRHAYGQYKQFLVGQTWSLLMDRAAEPEEIDFEGLSGQINERQPQARWTRGRGEDVGFALSLEDPLPKIKGGQGVSVFGDVVARRWRAKPWGHLSVAAVLRDIRAQWDLDPSVEHEKLGFGLSFSGKYKFKRWGERDNLTFQLNYGKGLGRYINDLDSAGGQDGVFNDETGDFDTLPVFGGYVAFQHWWKGLEEHLVLLRDLRSTFVFSHVNVDNLAFQTDDSYSQTRRATMNILWSPISAIDLGLEFLWGERKNKDTSKGTAKQFQFVATFRF